MCGHGRDAGIARLWRRLMQAFQNAVDDAVITSIRSDERIGAYLAAAAATCAVSGLADATPRNDPWSILGGGGQLAPIHRAMLLQELVLSVPGIIRIRPQLCS